MIKKLFSITAFSIFLWGCATTMQTPAETETQLVSGNFSEVTQADLKMGYKLYLYNCGGCHLLYRPSEHTEQEWQALLPEMADRAKLNEEERGLIFKYLVAELKKSSRN